MNFYSFYRQLREEGGSVRDREGKAGQIQETGAPRTNNI